MSSIANRSNSAAILAGYVVLALYLGVFAARDAHELRSVADQMPALTGWTVDAYTYTPWFLVGAFPAILNLTATNARSVQQQTFLLVSAAGLALLATWVGLWWLGLGFVISKIEAATGAF